MDFVVLHSFTNYMDAHIVKGRLEEEGIRCWLKDEHSLTTMPIWNIALGGMRLMVADEDAETARQLLADFLREKQARFTCPHCGSGDIETVSSPKKPSNWIAALGGYLFGGWPLQAEMTWHCFSCGNDFKEPEDKQAGDLSAEH